MRDVVITGIGVVSPIGIGREAFWNGLVEGHSGVGPLTSFDTSEMPVRFGGQIRDFDPKLYVRPRKSLKVMSREIQLGFTAADLALIDAGLPEAGVAPERFGVIFGADMIYTDLADVEGPFRTCRADGRFHFDRWAEAAAADLYPLWLLKHLPNMIASHVAIAHDARGPNNTIVLGDVSSLLAIAEAASIIARGAADVMIAGGAGCRLHPLALLARGETLLSHRHEGCEQACRPFDRDRDGMVNGEGAGAFVLESAEHARRRQASPWARIAATVCRHEPRRTRTAPLEGRSLAAAIRGALAVTGVTPADLSHVNANGLATPTEDRLEAEAISKTLGRVPVTAPKGSFGHLGAGSGAVELAASILGLEHGLIPPTCNHESTAADCPVDVVHGQPRPAGPGAILKVNVARTGQAAATVVMPLRTSRD